MAADLADLRDAAQNGAPLADLADLADVTPATLARWIRWAAAEDPDAPRVGGADADPPFGTFDDGGGAALVAPAGGESAEHVRAVAGAIRTGRREGRAALLRQERDIITAAATAPRTGDTERLRAIRRRLDDLNGADRWPAD